MGRTLGLIIAVLLVVALARGEIAQLHWYAVVYCVVGYSLAAAVFHRRFQQSPSRLEPLPTADLGSLSHDRRDFLANARTSLESLGFAHAACTRYVPTTDIEIWACVFVDRRKGDLALSAVSVRAPRGVAPPAPWVEFSSEFENGLEVTTSSSGHLPAFAHDPLYDELCLPGAQPQQLHRIHQQRTGERDERKRLPAQGLELAGLSESSERIFDRQVMAGRLRRGERAGTYQLTWRGAFVSAFLFVPPAPAIRSRLRKRRNAAVLAGFGVTAGSAADSVR